MAKIIHLTDVGVPCCFCHRRMRVDQKLTCDDPYGDHKWEDSLCPMFELHPYHDFVTNFQDVPEWICDLDTYNEAHKKYNRSIHDHK